MSFSESFLREFGQEVPSTRTTLERVPMDQFDWKPHDKSMSIGALASHVAGLPSWVPLIVAHDEFDAGGGEAPPPPPSDTKGLLELFDKNVSEAQSVIESAADEAFGKTWSLVRGGEALFSAPKAGVIRRMMLHHMIHHRAQLGVYLRLRDIPVPSVYGPSADENPFES